MSETVNFEVLEPGSKNHGKISKVIESVGRKAMVDYNRVAKAYNESRVGAIVLLSLPDGYKVTNIVRVLENRGLKKGIDRDFSVVRMTKTEDGTPLPSGQRPLALQKHSERLMRLVGTTAV